MAKNWTTDTALIDAVSGNLFAALPLLPKRLVRVEAIMKELDMPFSHVQILCMLHEGAMSIGEISRRLGIAKPNITPLLDHLHQRGLLTRERSDEDRRVVLVTLMPEGEACAARIREEIGNQVIAWPEEFSHSDIKRLNNALALLVDTARRLAEDEKKN